jgi:hypothetical protein
MHRRGTTAEWKQLGSELIPYEGEIVIEICEDNQHRLKIGDGVHTYEQLSYLVAGDTPVTQSIIRQATVTLYADNWAQRSDDKWYQDVEVVGTTVTAQDKIDLQLNAEQVSVFRKKGLGFVTENNGGIVSVCCVGKQVPENDYTIQVTVLNVDEIVNEVIVGNTIATPNPAEIYVGDGDMPETATMQIIFDGSGEGGITVPTKMSDLENDVGYITRDEILEEVVVGEIDENALNELLIDKCGDVQNYGEFVTALRSNRDNPGFIDLGLIEEINGVVDENGNKGVLAEELAFEVTFRIDEADTVEDTAIFGARRAKDTNHYSVYGRSDMPRIAVAFAYYGGNPNLTQLLNYELGKIYSVRFGANGATISANGVPAAETNIIGSYTEIKEGVTFPYEKNMYLFALNQTGTITSSNPFGAQNVFGNGGTKAIYDFKIYVGDILIRHLKPYVNTRGIPCMKDIVNDREYPATKGALVAEV